MTVPHKVNFITNITLSCYYMFKSKKFLKSQTACIIIFFPQIPSSVSENIKRRKTMTNFSQFFHFKETKLSIKARGVGDNRRIEKV